MARLSLSDEDGLARKWFIEETESLGCTTTIDQMGNIFARLPGKSTTRAPMTAMGSHLDTQPRGGRYDGILGVVAAVEALKTIKENGWTPNYDIGAINWTKYQY
jgi:acetylornithine deacetylase/succinyl-diaminopimelate desuccinylase-like protein